MYEPLEWHRYSGDRGPQLTKLLRTLIQVSNPTDEDLCRITVNFNALHPITVLDFIRGIPD
jgi:hypothetical protein